MRKHGNFSGPHFPLFGLNMEIYYINPRVQSEYGPEKTPYLGSFHTVPSCSIYSNANFNILKQPLIVVLPNSCSEKFLKFHRKIPTMETFLLKLQTQDCRFIKKTSSQLFSCFRIFRITFL